MNQFITVTPLFYSNKIIINNLIKHIANCIKW
jgi:hypothetical protein